MVSRQTIAIPAGAGISYSHSRDRASCALGISASSAAVCVSGGKISPITITTTEDTAPVHSAHDPAPFRR
jgi:hypothetical protein